MLEWWFGPILNKCAAEIVTVSTLIGFGNEAPFSYRLNESMRLTYQKQKEKKKNQNGKTNIPPGLDSIIMLFSPLGFDYQVTNMY